MGLFNDLYNLLTSTYSSVIENGKAFVKDYYSDTSTDTAGVGSRGSGFEGTNINPLGDKTLNPTGNQCWGLTAGHAGAFHNGADIGAVKGTPVYAIRAGTVSKSANNNKTGGRGEYIEVKNDNANTFAAYLVQHLSKRLVNVGDRVTAGQLIGYTGNTPSGDYHLHWEIHKTYPTSYNENNGGTSMDPMSITYTNLTDGQIQEAQTDGEINLDGSDGDTAITYQHIYETNQYFTVYDDDKKRKAVDKYRVAFKKWDSDKVWDISDVFSDLNFKDSTSEVCTQMAGTIIANKYDKYLKKLNPQTGDKISLVNTQTGQTIFTGMVISINKSGLTGVTSIDALDNGRMLTLNNIITQFQNQPVADVISTCANKAGVAKISCFPFVSTWTGTYSGKASDLITTCLEQISQENGVKYFMRVINDTIVIKSYSNNVITPFWKPSENIEAAPCFGNASEYTYNEDATNLATKILVSENQNGVNVVVAEKESDVSKQRWGATSQIIQMTGYETVDADGKALYNLYYGEHSEPTQTYSVSAPGSDLVVAGSLIKMYLDGVATKFWVTEVEHSYYPTHTMKLTLEKYEEPLDIATLRALYQTTEEGTEEEEEEEEEEPTNEY